MDDQDPTAEDILALDLTSYSQNVEDASAATIANSMANILMGYPAELGIRALGMLCAMLLYAAEETGTAEGMIELFLDGGERAYTVAKDLEEEGKL